MAALGKAVDDCEARCEDPLERWRATVAACAIGFWMLFRGAIYRYPTRSWTYIAQVGFGPFAFSTACALIAAMTLYRDTRFGFGWPIDWKLTFAYAALTYLAAAWIGIFYRVFRLCAARGDRTIEHYANRFTILRALALQRRRIEAVYLAWP